MSEAQNTADKTGVESLKFYAIILLSQFIQKLLDLINVHCLFPEGKGQVFILFRGYGCDA